jgi:hypothetical protein
VICKDCRPSRGRDVGSMHTGPAFAGIELCERHAEMEQKLATLEALFANVEDEAKERRRYAVLGVAAILRPHVHLLTGHNMSVSVDVEAVNQAGREVTGRN